MENHEVCGAASAMTLENLPPNRRARVARLFRASTSQQAAGIALELKESPKEFSPPTTDEDVAVNMQKLTACPAPTKEQVDAKREACQALQKKILAARQRKAVLERRVRELEIAKDISNWPETSAAEKVQDSVSTLMLGVHGVEDCQEQGLALVQESKKRRRQSNGSSTNLGWDRLVPQPKTVEEEYQQDRKRMPSTVKELQQLHALITGKGKGDDSE